MPNTVRLVDGDEIVTLRPEFPSADDEIFESALNLGFPEAREVRQDAAGADGQIDLTSRFGARTVGISLKVRGPNREIIADALRALSLPNRRPYLYVQRPGWETERRMLLRPNPYSCEYVSKSAAYLEIELSYQVPSGVMEAADEFTVPIFPPSATSGLEIAVAGAELAVAGAELHSGSGTNIVTINNPGTVTTPVRMQIYGRAANPALNNRRSVQVFELGTEIADGAFIDIDTRAHTALINGDPLLSAYNYINFSAGNPWFGLEKGDSEISFDASNVTDNCIVYVIFRPSWV